MSQWVQHPVSAVTHSIVNGTGLHSDVCLYAAHSCFSFNIIYSIRIIYISNMQLDTITTPFIVIHVWLVTLSLCNA